MATAKVEAPTPPLPPMAATTGARRCELPSPSTVPSQAAPSGSRITRADSGADHVASSAGSCPTT